MRHGALGLLSLVALLTGTPGHAAETAAASGKEPVSEVTVRGNKPSELLPRLSGFAYGITEPVNGEGLARWNVPVCPLVSGLARDEGEFVLQRLSDIARTAGVPLAGERCRPNLYVMVTGEPRRLLQAMADHKREVVFANASPTAVDAFIARTEPVRVWYSTYRTVPGGAAPSRGAPPAAQLLGGGLAGAPTYTGSWLNNSHLQAPSEFNLNYVYVIADASRLRGLSRGQFADYVAMMGLAQLKDPPHLGDAPTILKLFSGTPADTVPELSSWDRAFLKALYLTDPSTTVQRNQLGLEMVRQIAPSGH